MTLQRRLLTDNEAPSALHWLMEKHQRRALSSLSVGDGLPVDLYRM
jgi:hypothetical protein